MSGNQESQAFMTANNSPIGEEEEAGSPTVCGCFRRFCFQSGEGTTRALIGGESGAAVREPWWRGKAKKMRELSEVVAGPRWKNLLRKIGRYCNPKLKGGYKGQFIYDAQSYALNFDNGTAATAAEEDDGLLRNFSSRYAAPAVGQQRKVGL
nr:Cathepsin L-like [Ipomoea batatas]